MQRFRLGQRSVRTRLWVAVECYSFGDARIEISAFTAVVWSIYRNKHMLKTSGLVRTVVSQATTYFTLITIVQIFTQIALNFMEVRSVARIPRCIVFNRNHYRLAAFKYFHSGECTVNSGVWNQITKRFLLCEVYMACMLSRALKHLHKCS